MLLKFFNDFNIMNFINKHFYYYFRTNISLSSLFLAAANHLEVIVEISCSVVTGLFTRTAAKSNSN